METAILTTADSLSAAAADWLDLWRQAPHATPFQSPMWLVPWWRHFGSNDLTVITLREADRLVGIAPLYVIRDDDESLGLLLGTGTADYLDVLCSAADPGGVIFETLQKVDCQLWDFQQLRSYSPLLRAKAPDGWTDNVEEQDPCLVLEIDKAGDELQGLTSTHFRKKLRYYKRSLACTFEEANAANLDNLLEALFVLHAARWQRRGMSGMLADDVIQHFHRQVARAMLQEGALRMYAMRSGERIVAVFYGFGHHDTVDYYLSGYDPELEKLSPGTVIVAHAIEQSVRAGARTFDFLRGAEDYKYAWGAKDRMNFRRQLSR